MRDIASLATETRSGAAFSPWEADLGAPIYAPADFELDACMKAAFVAQAQAEVDLEDEEELHVESVDTPSSSSPPASSQHLRTTCALPFARRLQEDATSATVVPLEIISKKKFHSKQRSKRRRLKERGLADEMDKTSMKKHSIKAVALKRRKAAALLATAACLAEDGARLVKDDNSPPNPSTESPVPIETPLSLAMDDVEVAKTGFIGRIHKQTSEDRTRYSKHDLLEEGFEYVAWDGRLSRPILDKSGRVFAVLAGRPQDPGWDSINANLQDIFENARDAYSLETKQLTHRRGNYAAVGVGISYGGGQQRASNLSQSTHNQAVTDLLLRHTGVRRVANFANTLCSSLHRGSTATMSLLSTRLLSITPRFVRTSPFAAATFNLGPETVTHRHRDHLNLPFGWCAVTAIGDFDPVAGGHLVLWELKMVFEFPPGSTILLPSALLLHSNTPIASGEHRYSFTQFSAGGLFRWAACRFRPMNTLTPEERYAMHCAGRDRWEQGVEMLSLWSELA
ncbi:hypothetical protein FKP32DRAFT_1671248 [Trametes sanguinea]|nr:hypothetical protein FKP32DRAFT_1671248 [Trametes sanguinea]